MMFNNHNYGIIKPILDLFSPRRGQGVETPIRFWSM